MTKRWRQPWRAVRSNRRTTSSPIEHPAEDPMEARPRIRTVARNGTRAGGCAEN
ncbi:hypothetical protein [Collinsella tanakaei]|jgi:hypothetical protein|uniref:hypothetical protein n=1 Tax=Collinsella tanakaei TaxID=626935 RepID=UPI0026EF9CBC|nr:hypothetical protein [Collinsella tanakaei]